MSHTHFFAAGTALALVTAPLSSQTLSVVTPVGDFGSQPQLTFGGTGIPNNYVMSNTLATQTALGGTQLFLSATARYDNPVVTNDGAGTFNAFAGVDQNPPSPLNPFALWNFDFAITGTNTDAWMYRLWYDFNPAVGNSGDYGYVTITPTQDSWNLGMDFLAQAFPQVVPPGFPSFDPNVNGEYGFALIAYNEKIFEIGRTAILVNVTGGSGGTEGDVVPEPATLSLLSIGLVGMSVVGRRRRKPLKAS